ncbi:MAG: hypothetical protein AVDCRST_MAG40-3467, partial [uncultured Gemmatimonadaceae bacterium]
EKTRPGARRPPPHDLARGGPDRHDLAGARRAAARLPPVRAVQLGGEPPRRAGGAPRRRAGGLRGRRGAARQRHAARHHADRQRAAGAAQRTRGGHLGGDLRRRRDLAARQAERGAVRARRHRAGGDAGRGDPRAHRQGRQRGVGGREREPRGAVAVRRLGRAARRAADARRDEPARGAAHRDLGRAVAAAHPHAAAGAQHARRHRFGQGRLDGEQPARDERERGRAHRLAAHHERAGERDARAAAERPGHRGQAPHRHPALPGRALARDAHRLAHPRLSEAAAEVHQPGDLL